MKKIVLAAVLTASFAVPAVAQNDDAMVGTMTVAEQRAATVAALAVLAAALLEDSTSGT